MQLDLFQQPDDSVTVTIEEWRECAGFPLYEVSTMGRFRNRKTLKLLRGTVAFNGYIHIGLMKDGGQVTKLAHRVIARTFLEQPSPQHVDVNHRNKVRADNRLSNLEWVTRSENIKHARRG